jgi:hypothetical protein
MNSLGIRKPCHPTHVIPQIFDSENRFLAELESDSTLLRVVSLSNHRLRGKDRRNSPPAQLFNKSTNQLFPHPF